MTIAPNTNAFNPQGAAAPQKVCNTCGASLFAKAEICPSCGVRQRSPVSKAALLLLTFFLGGIGGHKFYLGKYWQGALYLLFCWTYIPGLIALIEFVIYVFTSSERLNEKYSASGSVVVIIITAVIGFVFMLGILAAIALPAFNDYSKKARVTEALGVAMDLRTRITETFAQRPSDMSCSQEACPMGSVPLGPTKYIKRLSSNRAGVIVIEFSELLSPAPQNRLSVVPMIDGRIADLSDPGNAGKPISWKCGGDGTTIAARNLPASCK